MITIYIYNPAGTQIDVTNYVNAQDLGDIRLSLEEDKNSYIADDMSLSFNNTSGYFTSLWTLPLDPTLRYSETTGKGAWSIKIYKAESLRFEGDLDASSVSFDYKEKSVSTSWLGASKRAEIPAEPLKRITNTSVYISCELHKRKLTFYTDATRTTQKSVASIGLIVGDRIKVSQLIKNGNIVDQEFEIKAIGPSVDPPLTEYQVKTRQGAKRLYTEGIITTPFWKTTSGDTLTVEECVEKCFDAIGVPSGKQVIVGIGTTLQVDELEFKDNDTIAKVLTELAIYSGCVWFRETSTGNWYFIDRESTKSGSPKNITSLLLTKDEQASDEDWYDSVKAKGKPPYFAPNSEGRAYRYGSGNKKTYEVETLFTSSLMILESIAEHIYSRICKIRTKVNVEVLDDATIYNIWDKISIDGTYYYIIEVTEPLRAIEYREAIGLTLLSIDGLIPDGSALPIDHNPDDDAPYPPTDLELGKGTDNPASRPAWWSEFRSQYQGGITEYPIKRVEQIIDDDNNPRTPPRVIVKRLWALRWKNEIEDDDDPDGFEITVFTPNKGIEKPLQHHGYRQPKKHSDGYYYYPIYLSTKAQAPEKVIVIRTWESGKDLSAYSDEVSTEDWGGSVEDQPPKTRPGTPPELKKKKHLSTPDIKIYQLTLNTDESGVGSEHDNTKAKRLFLEEIEVFSAPNGTEIFSPVRVGSGTVTITSGSPIIVGSGTKFFGGSEGSNPEVSLTDALIFTNGSTPNGSEPTYGVMEIIDDEHLVLDEAPDFSGEDYYIWNGYPDTNPAWELELLKKVKNKGAIKGKIRFAVNLTDDDISKGGLDIMARVKDELNRVSPWIAESSEPPPPFNDSVKFAYSFAAKSGSYYTSDVRIFDNLTESFGNNVAPAQNPNVHTSTLIGLTYSYPLSMLVISNYINTTDNYRKVAVSNNEGQSWIEHAPAHNYPPAQAEDAFAGIGGMIVDSYDYGSSHAWCFSTDGVNWNEITSSAVCDGQTSKAIDPNNPNKVWLLALGGGNGIYYSENQAEPVLVNSAITYGGLVASRYTTNRLYIWNKDDGYLYYGDNCHQTFTATKITTPNVITAMAELGDRHLIIGEAGGGTANNKLGIRISTDDGANWTQINPTPTIPCGASCKVEEIEVHPADHNCIVAMVGTTTDADSYVGTCDVVNNGDGTATLTKTAGLWLQEKYIGSAIWLEKAGVVAKGYRIINYYKDIDNVYHIDIATGGSQDPPSGANYNFSHQSCCFYLTTDGFATIKFIAPPFNCQYNFNPYSALRRQLCFCSAGVPAPPSGNHNTVYFGFTNTETEKRGIVATNDLGKNIRTVWKDQYLLCTPPVGGLQTENDNQDILYVGMPIDHTVAGQETIVDHAKKSLNGGYDLGTTAHLKFFKNLNQVRQIENSYQNTTSFIVAKKQGTGFKVKVFRTSNRTQDTDFAETDWEMIWDGAISDAVAIGVDKNNDIIVYMLCQNGKVYKSTDSGSTWDSGNATGISTPTWLAVGKDYIYACGDGTAGQVVKRASINDLTTWTTLTIGSLTTLEPYGLIIGEETQNIVIAVSRDDTNKGLYISENSGNTFTKLDGTDRYRCGIEIVGQAGTFLIGCNGKIKSLYKRNGIWYLQEVDGDSGSTNRNFCFICGKRKYYGHINPM